MVGLQGCDMLIEGESSVKIIMVQMYCLSRSVNADQLKASKHGGEDWLVFQRVSKFGYKIWVLPDRPRVKKGKLLIQF